MKAKAAVAWGAGKPLEINEMITHTMTLEKIDDACDLVHAGKSIRSVIHF